MSVTVLAGQLGVAKSTVSRLLKALVEDEFATRMPNGRFQLGPGALRGPVAVVGPLIQEISPAIRQLAAATGQTVHLGVLLGTRCMIVARGCERDGGSHVDEVKEGFPLWATALGKALLATQVPGERLRLLPAEPYPTFTPTTARTASELFTRIAQDAPSTMFLDTGEFHAGFRCVAHAIPTRGAVTAAALAVSYPASALDSAVVIDHMHRAAHALATSSL